jgi:hypothetical protein
VALRRDVDGAVRDVERKVHVVEPTSCFRHLSPRFDGVVQYEHGVDVAEREVFVVPLPGVDEFLLAEPVDVRHRYVEVETQEVRCQEAAPRNADDQIDVYLMLLREPMRVLVQVCDGFIIHTTPNGVGVQS